MTDTAPSEDRYLSLDDLASYSGLSRRTLHKYLVAPSNPLPFFKVGARILVRRSDFDRWIREVGTPAHTRIATDTSDRVASMADLIRRSR